MGSGANQTFAEQVAGALAWWREAGVDCDFVDAPRSWLAEPASADPLPAAAQRRDTARAPAVVAPAAPPLPGDLAAFRQWWLREPSLDSEHLSGRIAPRGEVGAKLMIVVASPESDDSEQLMAGADGRLVDAFLAAAGIAESEVYRASVMPCHSPGMDWSEGATRTLAAALVRHVAIVRPQRLLVLGLNILPLLGHDSPHRSAVSTIFNHEDVRVPLLAVRKIPARTHQARWKAGLWRTWLDWTA